jgi:DNA-binding MarR family transcriptional regulator
VYFVGRNPNIAVQSLLEILAVSKQALHTPLRHLLERKLVAARSNDEDRRFRYLSLTQEGRKLEDRLTGTQMKRLAAVFNETGDKNEHAWKAIMRAMREA